MHRARPAASFVVLISAAAVWGAESQEEAAKRALQFLSREVPSWSIENKCYSCHNNGDAARRSTPPHDAADPSKIRR